ncbi:recombinase family protein [Shinella zoogloeoides]|uniref:recombinase family protein n=1 Tax=Shinella zoogloeoides TaxID=352475 RepID=UPI0028ACBA0D|nr:recombinase family protein [Shinella zoogloeoides]
MNHHSAAPTGQLVGYARTSTTDQKAGLERQLRDLRGVGCHKVFSEEVSSVDKVNRVELERALEYVRTGDTFIVTKLDRLARSVADLVKITARLEEKGVGLRVLAMNLDTTTPHGKLMVNLLGSIAQFERELMLERQREGIAKAKADGRYKGRKPVAEDKAEEVVRLRYAGKTVEEIVAETGVGRTTVFKILKESGTTEARSLIVASSRGEA